MFTHMMKTNKMTVSISGIKERRQGDEKSGEERGDKKKNQGEETRRGNKERRQGQETRTEETRRGDKERKQGQKRQEEETRTEETRRGNKERRADRRIIFNIYLLISFDLKVIVYFTL